MHPGHQRVLSLPPLRPGRLDDASKPDGWQGTSGTSQSPPIPAHWALVPSVWCLLFQWSPSEQKPGQAMSPEGLGSL